METYEAENEEEEGGGRGQKRGGGRVEERRTKEEQEKNKNASRKPKVFHTMVDRPLESHLNPKTVCVVRRGPRLIQTTSTLYCKW
jgi:hypothetical protein